MRSFVPRRSTGFTLIEMIGVLAVIAILAALLIPKIFEAINSARINNCVVSYNTIKTATMDHYGKYGKINSYFLPLVCTTIGVVQLALTALFRQISSQPSGVLVCLDSRGELATWGLCRNFVTAFMSFCSTNPLARCRKSGGGIPDATQQNRAFMLD